MSSPALGTQRTLNKCGLKGGRDTARVLFAHVVESPLELLRGILQVVVFKMAFQAPGKYGDAGTEWGVDLTARQLPETDGDRCLMGFRMRELPRLFPDHLPLDTLLHRLPQPPLPHLYTFPLLLWSWQREGEQAISLLPGSPDT